MAEETPDTNVEEVETAAAGEAGGDPTKSVETGGEPTGEAPESAAPSTPKTQTRREKLEARRDLFGLRMQHATGELENSAGLRTAKRDLARALTVAQQRGVDPTEIKKSDG